MKTLKRIALIVFLAIAPSSMIQAQCSIQQWLLSRSWSNGFNALPDVCTNLKEFHDQYQKNQPQWDAMFKWLATHDLQSIPAGKHPIEGTLSLIHI